MKKIYYNKLVRDNIPNVIKSKGGDFKVKRLNNKEFEKALILKVGEEASGLVGAKDKETVVSELADIIDVIDALKKFKKITTQGIKKAQKAAFKKKGGFNKKLFLHWSSDTGYRTNEKVGKMSRNKGK